MTIAVTAPLQGKTLDVMPLSQDTFHAFGTVIENPAPSLIPAAGLAELPPNAVEANQGTALKYLNVTHMLDLYASAQSRTPSKAVMNMFVCAPRHLQPGRSASHEGLFPVEILERHPFTTQTFVPLGLSAKEQDQARYLVIVAPSLPPTGDDDELPVPSGNNLPGRGLPDLDRMRAFVAKGSQAVTYGAGTWHAPMVAIGSRPIDFVVIQFANGVGMEDCQEAAIERGPDGSAIVAAVPTPMVALQRASKL